jgi:DNA-binding phage protein
MSKYKIYHTTSLFGADISKEEDYASTLNGVTKAQFDTIYKLLKSFGLHLKVERLSAS